MIKRKYEIKGELFTLSQTMPKIIDSKIVYLGLWSHGKGDL